MENSICVTSTGYLVISLITEDYQALGLEGKASSFDREPHTRYGKLLKNDNLGYIKII